MIVRMEDHRGPAPTQARKWTTGPRRLRYNQVELTEREQRVLGLLVQGRYNRDLARELEISVRAVEHHLEAIFDDFGHRTEPPAKAHDRRRVVTALLVPVTGALAVGGVLLKTVEPPSPEAAAAAPAKPRPYVGATERAERARRKPALPRGVSTATSFWDSATATGRPMSFRTLASPYWPLGTKVRILYRSRSAVGVVEDFGPAEWAVAQHDVPAIVDVSEAMMAYFTGARVNRIVVRFEVLAWGTGGTYRDSGTGHDLATGR